jgi:protein-S-isoprenylcysteine O-methyltransferase Ste14
LIRTTGVTVAEVLLFGACLFGAAGSLSWPMAWAVLGTYSLLALGSIWAVLPAALRALLFVARTSREDRTLRERLVGYREYQARVRWRLLPRVW